MVLAWFSGSRGEGAEIVQQAVAAESQFAGGLMAMKSAMSVEDAIQAIRQAVHHVAGAVALRVRVRSRIFRRLVPQVGQDFLHGGGPSFPLGLLLESLHSCRKLACVLRAVDLPDAAVQLVRFAAAVANLQEPMQKTEHHHDRREAFAEGVLRGGPAIGVDRLRSVIGSHVARLGREGSVSGRQVLFVGRLG